MRAEARSEALTTAIAAGLIGLPAPAVDAPPGPTGPPDDRGFARALDRAAPPSEAPTQESPPPGSAVAEPTGDASHEVGTATSEQQSGQPDAAGSSDTVAEVGHEVTSMPDRPAGVVEGAQEAVVPETGALEAMMAAVLFRPAPAPEQPDSTSAVPAVPAGATSGGNRSSTDTSIPLVVGVLAQSATGQVESSEVLSAIAVSGVTPDAASEAMRVAAQMAQRFMPIRGKTDSVTRDASVISTADMEATPPTLGSSDDTTVSAVTASVDSAATASVVTTRLDSTAVSTSLSSIEGINDVEAIEVRAAIARPDAHASVHGDEAEIADIGSGARPALVSNLSPMAETAVAPAAAAKAGGVQSLPVASQVAETVKAAVMRGDHEIRLLLNPGDLGQIDIRITEQNGALHLRLDATRGSTRDLLAREMPVLQQALESRDLRVERIQVSHSGSASADGSGAAWQGFGGRQGQQRERDGSPAWSPVASFGQSEGGQQEMRRAPRVIRHNGVLDRVA